MPSLLQPSNLPRDVLAPKRSNNAAPLVMTADQDGVCPVVREWAGMEALMGRASTGRLAVAVGKLTRQTCVDNADLLIPLIKEFGILPEISQLCLRGSICMAVV